jgi:hypothetical protein
MTACQGQLSQSSGVLNTTFEKIASVSPEERERQFPIPDFVHVPLSIKISEILEYLECADFEDLLTAVFFQNADRMPLRQLCSHGDHRSEIRSVDVWMVEITQRTGKIWRGKVQVEITEGRGDASKAELSAGHRYAELFFALDTESGELILPSNADSETQSKHQIS